MKVLITGGLGFIGSHLAQHFAASGDEVVLFDNYSRPTGKTQYAYNSKVLSSQKKIKCVRGDVRNLKHLAIVAKDSDAIFHTAGQVAITDSIANPLDDFEVNVGGTVNVLEAGRSSKSEPRIIFCSTNKVYGSNVNSLAVKATQLRYVPQDPSFRGFDETTPVDGTHHTPYGSSKLAADIYVQDYFHTYGLKTTVFRLSCIYGDRQFGFEDQGWLSWLATCVLTNRPITIYGDGKQVRDVLFVDDLVNAFAEAYGCPETVGNVFNIGGGPENTLSLLELLNLLEEITAHKPKTSFSDWRPADQKIFVSDIRRAERIMGWEPKVKPEKGVRRMVTWLSDNIAMFRRDSGTTPQARTFSRARPGD